MKRITKIILFNIILYVNFSVACIIGHLRGNAWDIIDAVILYPIMLVCFLNMLALLFDTYNSYPFVVVKKVVEK